MEFKCIGHTSLPMLHKVLEKEALEANAKGFNIQTPKGLRKLLTTFEDKSLTGTSPVVDRFLELVFFFELDWCLVQDITYYAPTLVWVYKEVPRTDSQRGIVKGSLEAWQNLSNIDKLCELPANLAEFVQHLKSYLGTIL